MQSFQKYFEQNGWSVELLAIPTVHSHGPRKFLEYHRKLIEGVRSKNVDVVLACDLYSLSAAAWMRKHGHATLALYDAREVYTELPSVAKRPLVQMIWKRLEKRGLAVTDVILVTAPHDLEAILEVHRFAPRSLLVRNLPWRDLSLSPDRSLLDQFSIPPDTKVFVYVGGLQRGRGLEAFFTAMQNEAMHLLLVGDGAIRANLETLAHILGIANRTHFAGAVESAKALSLAAACDFGVVLIESVSKSYELALPSKVFEYMMAGLPILSSKMRHVTELFEGEEWIIFADVEDINSIKDGIRRLIQMSHDRALRGRERALSLEHYHFERDAAPLLSLINSKLANT